MISAVYFIQDNRAIKNLSFYVTAYFQFTCQESSNFPAPCIQTMIVGLQLPYLTIVQLIIVQKTKVKQFLSTNNRLRLGLLNKSFLKDIVINKEESLGFFVIQSNKQCPVKYEAKRQNEKTKNSRNKQQRRGFLNRYNFTYAGRDTVNQVGKIAPGLIKNASSEIKNISQQQINQIIRQGGQEIERILSKIQSVAIEDVYQIPFRMLIKFGKRKLQKI